MYIIEQDLIKPKLYMTMSDRKKMILEHIVKIPTWVNVNVNLIKVIEHMYKGMDLFKTNHDDI